MKTTLLPLLRCPVTGAPYELEVHDEDGGEVRAGLLRCRASASAVPIVAGFPLFTEARFDGGSLGARELAGLEDELFGDARAYDRYLTRKWRRPTVDAYAAFQPFNESTQALFPLVQRLRAGLEPGDVILDTWCRTGWTGELLAALFPEQRIVSLWEGNSDVLGYRGFRHWLPAAERAPNLEILFHDPSRPLPFASHSVGAVIGLDSLHRYDATTLVPECLRVTRPDGPIVFPHVHLSNSEPDPWFDRGCTIRPGRDYARAFARLFAGTSRVAFVLSEAGLFEGTYTHLDDDADTPHYNALVLLADESWRGTPLAPVAPRAPRPGDHAVCNPLYRIDLDRCQIAVDPAALNGSVGHLLSRHPVYERHLDARRPETLSPAACELLYWVQRALDLGTVAARMGRSFAELAPLVAELARSEVLQVQPISAAMARLHLYYHQQVHRRPAREETLAALWERSCASHGERPFLVTTDQGTFSYGEADALQEALMARLCAAGVGPGDHVGVHAEPRAEVALLFWALARIGAVLAPLDSGWPSARAQEALARLAPKLVFADGPRAAALAALAPCVQFDPEDEEAACPPGVEWFSEWLEQRGAAPVAGQAPRPGDVAAILFTSGTTGRPKAVPLTHCGLLRSAELLAGVYDWTSDDVLLSLGEFHTMSGLRNPLIATVCAGAACVLPEAVHRTHVLGAVELVGTHGVTLLSTVPAFLRRLVRYRARVLPEMLASLRAVLSTAAPLDQDTLRALRPVLDVPVHDYYGLTETSGACIFEPPGRGERERGSIGRPLGMLAQVVAPDGQILACSAAGQPGCIGELRIYGENLMGGYVGDPERTREVLRDGWLYTGDLACWSAEGGLALRGRARDIVKDLRGDLIYPAEVEAVALGTPGVEEVCVCGYTDAHGDERLAAFVVPAPGAPGGEELRRALADHVAAVLGETRVPSEVFVVGELPRAANEKPMKSELIGRYLSHD